MIRIIDRKPEEVLKEQFVEKYKSQLIDIWYRLVQVNTSITILENIRRYPLQNIYAPQENVFWEMTFLNFFGNSVVTLYTLSKDKTRSGRANTLTDLKNKIITSWIKEAYKTEFQEMLKNTKIDKRLEKIQDKISQLRNNIYAHRFINNDGTLSNNLVQKLRLEQLREYYGSIEKLFRSCTFACEYVTSLYPQTVPGDEPEKKDIEEILDLIIKIAIGSINLNAMESFGQ